MKFDNKKIKEHKQDFTFFKGFVPPILIRSSGVSIVDRDQFLKEESLYNYVYNKLQEFKKMMDFVDDPADYEVGEILKFIEVNPQFKDILIQA